MSAPDHIIFPGPKPTVYTHIFIIIMIVVIILHSCSPEGQNPYIDKYIYYVYFMYIILFILYYIIYIYVKAFFIF